MIEVLKLEIEGKELSVSVSTSYVDKQENEFLYEKFSSSALYSNHKFFVKGRKATSCVFCGPKRSSYRCLLISETSASKKLIKQKEKCHGRHSIAICTFF